MQLEQLGMSPNRLMSTVLQPDAGTSLRGRRAQLAVAIAVDKRFLQVPHVACT